MIRTATAATAANTPPIRKSRLAEVKTGTLDTPERVFIYGQEGVGKSTYLASCHGIIVIGETDGTRRLDVARYPAPDAWTWEYLLDALDDIATGSHSYQAIGIDGMDWLEPINWDCVCREGDAKGPRRTIKDFGFQEGYVAALAKWRDLAFRLDRLRHTRGMHVILTAHSSIKTQTMPGSDVTYDRYETALYNGKNASSNGFWKGWCDHLLFAHHDDMVRPNANGKGKGIAVGTDLRLIETRHTASWDAKSRYPLPDQMPLESGWPGLMAEIKNSEPESANSLLCRIDDTLKYIGDQELTDKVKETIEQHRSNATMLARVLNRITAISQERAQQ
jgi:AAA domain